MKQIVYVASPESQQIHVWQLDDAGALALLQTVDVPGRAADDPSSGQDPPVRRRTPGVRHRQLPHRGGRHAAAGRHGAAAGQPDPYLHRFAGRYLFSASYSGNCASISPIGHDGVVTAPIQQIDGLTAPHSANIDPTNQLVLVPCLKRRPHPPVQPEHGGPADAARAGSGGDRRRRRAASYGVPPQRQVRLLRQ